MEIGNWKEQYKNMKVKFPISTFRERLPLCFDQPLIVNREPFLMVRSKINLHFQVLRRTHGKARGGRIAGYLTNEQRSHAGWIGASKCEVIFERALNILISDKRIKQLNISFVGAGPLVNYNFPGSMPL